jgi:hypothetical protein
MTACSEYKDALDGAILHLKGMLEREKS